MADMINVSKAKTQTTPSRSSPGKRGKESPQSPTSPVNQILHLQRTMGNQEVQRLLKSGTIQANLKIGQPNDKYEQEADRVADKVMTMPEPNGSLAQRQSTCPECPEEEGIQTKPLDKQITPLVQRQEETGPEEEEEEKEPVQAKLNENNRLQRLEAEPEEEEDEEAPEEEKAPEEEEPGEEEEKENEEPAQAKSINNKSPPVKSGIQSKIQSIKGGGQPLSKSTRAFFEPRFGRDFSQVRLHTDAKAADAAKSINAKAFTTGKNVFFGAGQYSPGTSKGKRLLAHELTHVVQQSIKKIGFLKIQRKSIFPPYSPKKYIIKLIIKLIKYLIYLYKLYLSLKPSGGGAVGGTKTKFCPKSCVPTIKRGKVCKTKNRVCNDCKESGPVNPNNKITHIFVDRIKRKGILYWNGKRYNKTGVQEPFDCTPNPSTPPARIYGIGKKCTINHTSCKSDRRGKFSYMAWFTALQRYEIEFGFHNSQPMGRRYKSSGCIRVFCDVAEKINKNTESGSKGTTIELK